ncbi:hypothetical protein EDB84DRAFT_1507379 [Lactarius hengduanensis]|nr:hypothetical protein EDB84DRAFT_1507379 [Lactarius hengduanensis]
MFLSLRVRSSTRSGSAKVENPTSPALAPASFNSPAYVCLQNVIPERRPIVPRVLPLHKSWLGACRSFTGQVQDDSEVGNGPMAIGGKRAFQCARGTPDPAEGLACRSHINISPRAFRLEDCPAWAPAPMGGCRTSPPKCVCGLSNSPSTRNADFDVVPPSSSLRRAALEFANDKPDSILICTRLLQMSVCPYLCARGPRI